MRRTAWFWVGIILLSFSVLLWLLRVVPQIVADPEDAVYAVAAGLLVTFAPIGIGVYSIIRARKSQKGPALSVSALEEVSTLPPASSAERQYRRPRWVLPLLVLALVVAGGGTAYMLLSPRTGIDDPFTLQMGESVAIEGTGLTVQLDNMVHGHYSDDGEFVDVELTATLDGSLRAISTEVNGKTTVGDYVIHLLNADFTGNRCELVVSRRTGTVRVKVWWVTSPFLLDPSPEYPEGLSNPAIRTDFAYGMHIEVRAAEQIGVASFQGEPARPVYRPGDPVDATVNQEEDWYEVRLLPGRYSIGVAGDQVRTLRNSSKTIEVQAGIVVEVEFFITGGI